VHWKSIWIAEQIGLAQLIVAYRLLIALLIPALVSGTIAQTVIGSRPFVFVGRRSYSMYLIELLAAQAVQGLLPKIHFGPLFLPVCFIVALVASDCLYRWIEKPMIRLGHKLVTAHDMHRLYKTRSLSN
jgi:peptidoglycan/LPS O-acetylase OafA/YrhL